MDRIFKTIEGINDEYLKIWEDVCNIESPTSCKEGVDRVGQYFAAMAKKRGWKTEYSIQEAAGDVLCITMNPDAEAAPVILSGHIDTVHPAGLFGNPPVHTDKENIYGPGVTDCKGGVVAAFMAMDALDKCGFDRRPVKLLIQTDEETGSKTSGGQTVRYICEKSKDALLFINLEKYNPGKATLSRKGIVSYSFDITGKEGHSSRCNTEGANAIVDAAYKILELNSLNDDSGITCNCAIVSGGTVLNTIPGKCSLSVNFRYVTNEQRDFIEDFVKKLALKEHIPGCKCRAEKIGSRPAMIRSEKNLKMLERINQIFAECKLPCLEENMCRGGSDAAYITQCNIPCIDSLGVEGGGTHSVNEFAKISSLSDAARRIAAIAYNICPI